MEAIGRQGGLRTPAEREFTLTRVIAAPREEVYAALLDRDLVPHWWGQAGFSTTVDQMDVRPGGKWRFLQRSQEGVERVFQGTYQDLDRPNRIEYTFEFEGEGSEVKGRNAQGRQKEEQPDVEKTGAEEGESRGGRVGQGQAEQAGVARHQVIVETMILEDEDNSARLSLTVRFADQEARDAALRSGLEEAALERIDRFEDMMKRRGGVSGDRNSG